MFTKLLFCRQNGLDSFITSLDEHEWETGECDHEEINEQESHVPYFEKNGKDFEALQKIVLDKKWIESLKYYVRFW